MASDFSDSDSSSSSSSSPDLLPRELLLRHGCPNNTHPDLLIRHGNVLISYNKTQRIANWTLEYLTPDIVNGFARLTDTERRNVRPDHQVEARFRVTRSDYDGYWTADYGFLEQGRLAAAANYASDKELLLETNFYTNVAPQVGPGFNSSLLRDESRPKIGRLSWKEGAGCYALLEDKIRVMVTESQEAWVVTGPLLVPRVFKRTTSDGKVLQERFVKYPVIGKNNVVVPTHFFKAILGVTEDGEAYEKWFLIENAKPSKGPGHFRCEDYKTTAKEVEDLLGYYIFPERKIFPKQ